MLSDIVILFFVLFYFQKKKKSVNYRPLFLKAERSILVVNRRFSCEFRFCGHQMCAVFCFLSFVLIFFFFKTTTKKKKKIPRILCTGTVVVGSQHCKEIVLVQAFWLFLLYVKKRKKKKKKKKKKERKKKSFPDPTRTGREATESSACVIGGAFLCNVNVPC